MGKCDREEDGKRLNPTVLETVENDGKEEGNCVCKFGGLEVGSRPGSRLGQGTSLVEKLVGGLY